MADKGGLYAKKSLVTIYVVMAVLGAALTAAYLATMRGSGALLLTVVGLLMAIWFTKVPVVRAFGDHVTIKSAPLAPRRDVLYSEIRALEEVSPKKVLLTAEIGGKTKTLRLPMAVLSPEDGAKLVALLRAKMPA